MSLYDLLGVKRDAGTAEIKRAYRKLARKFHPDINPGDKRAEARFRQISEAYETLVDPQRRGSYDTYGTTEPSPTRASYGFAGFDFETDGERFDYNVSAFGDLFADVFNRSREPRPGVGPQRGDDLELALTVSFDEAFRGTQQKVTVTRREYCANCRGRGMLHEGNRRCAHCHGTGQVRSTRGHMVFSKNCSHCAGTGELRQQPCAVCGGDGLTSRAELLTVTIPAGVADGSRVRVPGKGNAGRMGGPTGDLYLTTKVTPHPLFARQGDDLMIVVPISVSEAALGARITVPTIDGSATLRIPPGTQTGQRFRLRDRGVPSLRSGRRGDQIVETRMVLPRVMDERSKELLREFGRLNPENPRKGLGV